MIELPEVTLCAVDTRTPDLAIHALERSRRGLRFARCLLLTHPLPASIPENIEAVDIGPISSASDYSRFMLGRLVDYIHTTHVLIVQWDGFVTDAQAWDSAFLQTDYLGAPWSKAEDERCVGNGGFSLRSRRLLKALQDPALRARWHHPEDICISQTLRPDLQARHGIVFGSRALASRFAFENTPPEGRVFGFHAAVNLPRILPEPALQALLSALPDEVVQGRDGFKLARALLRKGQAHLARPLLARRIALGADDLRTRLLSLRARLSSRSASG